MDGQVGSRGQGARASGPTEASQEGLAFWRDRAQRLQAEMENYRKRQQRMADSRVDDARRELLISLLPIVDDLNRALSVEEADATSLREGVRLIQQHLGRYLEQQGVVPLQASGKPFDPTVHEAVATVPARDEKEVGRVVQVESAGYRLGDRLLRPARVVVAA